MKHLHYNNNINDTKKIPTSRQSSRVSYRHRHGRRHRRRQFRFPKENEPPPLNAENEYDTKDEVASVYFIGSIANNYSSTTALLPPPPPPLSQISTLTTTTTDTPTEHIEGYTHPIQFPYTETTGTPTSSYSASHTSTVTSTSVSTATATSISHDHYHQPASSSSSTTDNTTTPTTTPPTTTTTNKNSNNSTSNYWHFNVPSKSQTRTIDMDKVMGSTASLVGKGKFGSVYRCLIPTSPQSPVPLPSLRPCNSSRITTSTHNSSLNPNNDTNDGTDSETMTSPNQNHPSHLQNQNYHYCIKLFSKEKIIGDSSSRTHDSSSHKDNKTYQILHREIELHSRLNHDNIIRYIGICQNDLHVGLAMEYCLLGDLFHYQLSYWGGDTTVSEDEEEGASRGLPMKEAAWYVYQILKGLAYMKSNHVYHRDIKPENILLMQGVRGGGRFNIAKICDFGWAVHARPPTPQYPHDEIHRITLCGTPEYIPFEMVNYTPVSYYYHPHQYHNGRHEDVEPLKPIYDVRMVDSWSVGILICDLVTGKSPFYVSSEERSQVADRRGYRKEYEAIFDRIREVDNFVEVVEEGDSAGRVVGGNACGEEEMMLLRDFVAGLTAKMVGRRLMVDEALNHSWITQYGFK